MPAGLRRYQKQISPHAVVGFAGAEVNLSNISCWCLKGIKIDDCAAACEDFTSASLTVGSKIAHE